MGKKGRFSDSIQKFGRTLLLPIGVLAPVGMILGISGAFVQPYMIERFSFLGKKYVIKEFKVFCISCRSFI